MAFGIFVDAGGHELDTGIKIKRTAIRMDLGHGGIMIGTDLLVGHEVAADGEGAGGYQLIIASQTKFGVGAEAKLSRNDLLIEGVGFGEVGHSIADDAGLEAIVFCGLMVRIQSRIQPDPRCRLCSRICIHRDCLTKDIF